MREKEQKPGDASFHKSRNVIESLEYAAWGVLYAVRTQRNMRIHALTSVLVLLAGIVVDASPPELAILVLTVGLVMAMEMVNTAIEAVVDMVTTEYHPLARIAKNVAAGSVLISAVAAVFVGLLIFLKRLSELSEEVLHQVLVIPETLTMAALGSVLIIVILVKAGAPRFQVQGGFPSVHTALAFALATLIWLAGAGGVVVVLALGIAALVGQARLEAKIHTVYEVVAGAVIGPLITLVVFQLLG